MSPAPDYIPGRRVIITSGRHARTVGCIQQPPGKAWPDEQGYIGVRLDTRKLADQGIKLFTPSQINLI
jgi:hypothetical protein